MININLGHNQELMDTCKSLGDYAKYVDRVRKYTKNMELAQAVERAVTECIQEGILADFLSKNKAEVIHVSIYEYDAKKHIRQEKEESWEEGFQDGEKKGFRDGERKGFQDGQELLMKQLIKVKLDNGKTITEIARELEQSEERIQELVGKLCHGE